MAKKQYTMRVEGFVTFTAEEGITLDDAPVMIDSITMDEFEESKIEEVHETKITTKEFSTIVDL